MPFSQHLDRTARVSEKEAHSVPSKLANLQQPQTHWPSMLRFKPRPPPQQPSLPQQEPMLNCQHVRSEPKEEQDETQAPLANIASLQTISGTI